jgi:hypothetical protein
MWTEEADAFFSYFGEFQQGDHLEAVDGLEIMERRG